MQAILPIFEENEMTLSPTTAKFEADLEVLASKMEPYAKSAFAVMPYHIQADIVMYCLENPTESIITCEDLIDAWLQWNGIIGYTSDLKSLFRHTVNHVHITDEK